ncbi:hypothetical protein PHLCEN_2v9245 [Hermanssonia centrifuga]|uniref:Uncharacterized protein n=1 Tax=Hermanssonia centrifuga TaxID=98765 RepID=A0A2R6NRA8_9APHY|nr:hypothetical protein PHLCEN_2v9245 [Hermanssonia centrifuga]
MSTPAANAAAFGSNDALRAAHNQLKFALWDDMEETRRRALETPAERMEWLEDCAELLVRRTLPFLHGLVLIRGFFGQTRFEQLGGNWDSVPVRKFFDVVANAVQNLPNSSWAQRVIFEFPRIVEFFPGRRVPSEDTRPLSLAPELVAAPAVPLVPRPLMPRVTFAPLPPVAPPRTLPSPSTLVDPTFRLARTASLPSRLIDPNRSPSGRALLGIDADGEEEAASDGEEEVAVPQPAARAAARGLKTEIRVHGGVSEDAEHCLPLPGVPVPAGGFKYFTWSEKCYKCVCALSWEPCVFDFFEKDGTLAAKCHKCRAGSVAGCFCYGVPHYPRSIHPRPAPKSKEGLASLTPEERVLYGLDKAPRTVRKGTRTGSNKRPRSSSGSSKDLQRPAKRFTIHIPARVVSALAIPSSHLVPPAAAAPRRSARLQATPLPPVVAPEPEVVPAVVEPSSPVEPAVLSGFGEATGPLAAVAGTTGTRAPSLSSSSPLPSYPASPTATPPPRFVTPLFTPPPLFLPGLTSPDVPEVVPTALSDGLEGSDPGIETAEGRLRPSQLPAHPPVF